MTNCLFCKIVAEEIPSAKVLENSDFLAFRDIDPKAPVHVLVIPKKHFEDIAELSKSRQRFDCWFNEICNRSCRDGKARKRF